MWEEGWGGPYFLGHCSPASLALHGTPLAPLVLGPGLALDNSRPETLALAFWPLPKSPPHAASCPSEAMGQRRIV